MTATTRCKTVDELVVFVLKHPIRVDALQILNEGEASAAQIARRTGQDMKQVGHHVKVLAEHGCIELVRVAQNRGAEEHFYVAALRPCIGDKEWALLAPTTRQEISALVFQAIVAEALAAFRNGTFDSRPDRHMSWQPLKLDEEGWGELMEELKASLERIEDIRTRAEERLIANDEKGFLAIAAALGFERGVVGRSQSPYLLDT
jgi:DNA-binding transcriptional ArsR family regulator